MNSVAEEKLRVLWSLITKIDDRIIILEYLYNRRIGNISLATYKSISEATGISTSRVVMFLHLLEEKDIIRRRGNGVFIVNEAVLQFERIEQDSMIAQNVNCEVFF